MHETLKTLHIYIFEDTLYFRQIPGPIHS